MVVMVVMHVCAHARASAHAIVHATGIAHTGARSLAIITAVSQVVNRRPVGINSARAVCGGANTGSVPRSCDYRRAGPAKPVDVLYDEPRSGVMRGHLRADPATPFDIPFDVSVVRPRVAWGAWEMFAGVCEREVMPGALRLVCPSLEYHLDRRSPPTAAGWVPTLVEDVGGPHLSVASGDTVHFNQNVPHCHAESDGVPPGGDNGKSIRTKREAGGYPEGGEIASACALPDVGPRCGS